MPTKPNVLVLGACGFVGRHLVDYLVTNRLVSTVRAVDKTPPQMAWMNKRHLELFTGEAGIVEFCSANLINEASCKNAFKTNAEDGWDIVFNCAAETRPGRSEAVYEEGITKLSLNCARQSASQSVRRYVELSSGSMVSSDKKPITEDCTPSPWTMEGRFKAKVEHELPRIDGLSYTIIRVPLVYGKGDRRGLMHRITIAAIYKYLDDTMKLLWNEHMKLNTVHVADVVESMWMLANNNAATNQIFNVVDDSNSTQGSISTILGEIYGIKVDYWGTILSNITKVNMFDALDEINEKHMTPWAELCQRNDITNTPLTPYMDEELLYHKHLHLDNAKLKATGYQFRHPKVTKELIEEIIDDFTVERLMPQKLNF